MNKKSSPIRIFDTTLRDGEQSPGNSMNTSEKLQIAKQLERLGVDVIEAGFPLASPEDFEAVQKIAATCAKPEICGLSRALEKDIRCTWDAVKKAKKPRIHTFVATSEIHMKYKLKKTKPQVKKMAEDAVKLARSLCDRVEFSAEDAFRSEWDFLFEVLEIAINAGADVVNIPDTVGYGTPQEYGALIAAIRENVPNIDQAIISTHCHNDLGLAVANSLAGVINGAGQVECTINGIGERAGNASLEEVVMALETRKDFFQCATGINTKEIHRSSKLLSSITGVPVQPNKAIVGANAFAHESGIHQHGVLKHRETYEIMKPEDIGLTENKMILGKHSGRHALKSRLSDLGYSFENEEVNELFDHFKVLADKKKNIYDEDIILLVNQIMHKEKGYVFRHLHVMSGTVATPYAEVTLTNPKKKRITAQANGDGPIDAAYYAIQKLIPVEAQLIEFSVNAVTEGMDAQATVAVQIQVGDRKFSGTGSDTDIIVASVKAYLWAMNKATLVQSSAEKLHPQKSDGV